MQKVHLLIGDIAKFDDFKLKVKRKRGSHDFCRPVKTKTAKKTKKVNLSSIKATTPKELQTNDKKAASSKFG